MINRMLKAGVVGWPISHSLSPTIHKYWLQQASICGDYIPQAIEPHNLKNFLYQLSEKGWCGVNVTLPHKRAALEYVDHLDLSAEKTGAVNTIIVQKDGSLKGINTDGYGFLKNLQQYYPDCLVNGEPVVVLGAGGAARAILTTLIENGSSDIRLVNRDQSKAEYLASEFNNKIDVYSWSDRSIILTEVKLLINTTSLGMIGQEPLEINLSNLPGTAVVYDIVYSPLETDLLRNAKQRGNETVDGLGMLLHQAQLGFYKWFGVSPEVSSDLRAHVINAMKN